MRNILRGDTKPQDLQKGYKIDNSAMSHRKVWNFNKKVFFFILKHVWKLALAKFNFFFKVHFIKFAKL